MRSQHPESGFTLLELLVAMTLLGLLLVMLYSGMNTSLRSWDRGEAYAERSNEIRVVQDFIRRQLRQSMTVFRQDPDLGRAVYFEGEPDSIGWVAPMLSYLGQGGLYFVRLDIAKAEDNAQDHEALRVSWHPYRPDVEDEDDVPEEQIEDTVLLGLVEEFSLSYFGAEEDGEDPEWYERWENQQRRPELIKLSLNLPDRAWPDLIVAIPN